MSFNTMIDLKISVSLAFVGNLCDFGMGDFKVCFFSQSIPEIFFYSICHICLLSILFMVAVKIFNIFKNILSLLL